MSRVATVLDKTGKVAKQPPFWVVTAALLARLRRDSGRPTAARALVGYASAGAVTNFLLKPVFDRDRPAGASGRFGPLTSSFPSGHSACATAFAVLAARDIPGLRVPMVALTTASHWSLWRSRSHYVTDILAGERSVWLSPGPSTGFGRSDPGFQLSGWRLEPGAMDSMSGLGGRQSPAGLLGVPVVTAQIDNAYCRWVRWPAETRGRPTSDGQVRACRCR